MLQRLEHEPEVGRVEGALQTLRHLGMTAVVRQRTSELIGPGLAALLLAHLAELSDVRSHVAHIVEGEAYHIRYIGERAPAGGRRACPRGWHRRNSSR